MLNRELKYGINTLYTSTPKDVSVGYGKKYKNGVYTGEICIVFGVEKKKPLSELSPDEVLPSSVEIGGKTYKTDVREIGKVRALYCDMDVITQCCSFDITPPANRNKVRPIKGGIQITSDHTSDSWGTIGLIAQDISTNALVGLTNNHVVVQNAFYTMDRATTEIENELDNVVYQNYSFNPLDRIGKVIRYVPISKYSSNRVDAALIGLDETVVSTSDSFKQYGLSYENVIPFASTSEIDNLSIIDPVLYSSGARTGAKEGICALTTVITGYSVLVAGYKDDGVENDVNFEDIIVFSRTSDECPYPIEGGDSGSALIADFDGVWKVVGLCFAGSEYYGFACRIDNVMAQLGINEWDGTEKPFIDFDSQEIISESGLSPYKTKSCEGRTFWQIGNGLTNNPC